MMETPEVVNKEVIAGADLCFVDGFNEQLVPEQVLSRINVCFSSLVHIKETKDLFHIGIPDITSHLLGDTQYSIEYIKDTLEFFSDICPHVVYETDFHKTKYKVSIYPENTITTHNIEIGVLFLSFRRSEVNGSLVLGFLNTLKSMAEFPLVPLNYYLLKRMYSDLNYYQLLVLSNCCTTKKYEKNHRNNWGNHEPFLQSNLNTIKGLTKQTLIAAWNRYLIFHPDNTLLKLNEFSTSDKSSNEVMLPPPWGLNKVQMQDRYLYKGPNPLLYLEEIEYYLNDDVNKPIFKRT